MSQYIYNFFLQAAGVDGPESMCPPPPPPPTATPSSGHSKGQRHIKVLDSHSSEDEEEGYISAMRLDVAEDNSESLDDEVARYLEDVAPPATPSPATKMRPSFSPTYPYDGSPAAKMRPSFSPTYPYDGSDGMFVNLAEMLKCNTMCHVNDYEACMK